MWYLVFYWCGVEVRWGRERGECRICHKKISHMCHIRRLRSNWLVSFVPISKIIEFKAIFASNHKHSVSSVLSRFFTNILCVSRNCEFSRHCHVIWLITFVFSVIMKFPNTHVILNNILCVSINYQISIHTLPEIYVIGKFQDLFFRRFTLL